MEFSVNKVLLLLLLLLLIVGVKKFHDYCYGRHFVIRTDHKPLLGLFSPQKATPEILSPRMLRWSIMLSAYDYDLEYVPGKDIGNADALSRLPLKSTIKEVPPLEEILMIEQMPEKILDAKEVAVLTSKDIVLSRVLCWIRKGWPDQCKNLEAELVPYYHRRKEISTYNDCLLWGSRVIIPPGGRKRILDLLHSSHPGIVKMKGLARSYVWWPNMDKEIERVVNTCETCQENRKMPNKSPVHPWEWSNYPWQRIHIDHAGPMEGNYFFIVVDSYSKWLEVRQVPSTSAAASIRVLRELFATHGIPEVCVSDNGTAFTSTDFQEFLRKNGIRQALVAPYHPSSNGQAERMVQNVKAALKKMAGSNLQVNLCRYLLSQHITPHSLTGKAPSEVLMNRKLNSLLDKVVPDFRKNMSSKIEMKAQDERGYKCFDVNDSVFARSFTPGKKWFPSTIVEKTGPLSYKVKTQEGTLLRRHSDQLRSRISVTPEESREENVPENQPEEDVILPQTPFVIEPPLQSPEASDSPTAIEEAAELVSETQRPKRSCRPPKYLEDFDVRS